MLTRLLLVFAAITVLWPAMCLADDGLPEDTSGPSLVVSELYVWKGDQHLREGREDLATESYLKASSYMRTSPSPHFALARVYLKRSPMDAFLEFATGLQLLISDFFYQSLVVSNLMVIALLAAGAGIYIAVMVIVVRHSRTVWLSTVLSIPPVLRGRYPAMVIIACLSAFFVLLSGRSVMGIITWTAVIGCGLLWRFASVSEKRTVVSFFVFLILLGVMLDATTLVVSTQHPDSPLRLASLADRLGRKELESILEAESTVTEPDAVNEFMQGFRYVMAGNYMRAIEHLEVALKSDPDNAAILNNLGVAFHGLGWFDTARQKFERAVVLSPREAVIHYNYSQTLNELLHYEQAQQELAKASLLDFDLTRTLMTEESGARLVPMNLQARVLWQLALSADRRVVGIDYHPVESGLTGTLIMVVLAGAAFVAMRRADCPARCEVCGCSVLTRVTKRRRKDILCPNCHRIRARSANDHDRLEQELNGRLGKLKLMKICFNVVVGLLVPGTTYHLSGKRFKGFMVSFGLFSLMILALAGGAVIKPVPQLRLDPLTGWALPAFVLAYAVYAWRSTVTAIRSARET
ncbi:MAG: tetratricopeptide repeat protein [Candidatus Eisenbacteria bacterium]